MHLLSENDLPKLNQVVIAYTPDALYVACYEKVLTWKGVKFKFVNVDKGLWRNDVVGWNKIPTREQTI
jgi:hypothetical protein